MATSSKAPLNVLLTRAEEKSRELASWLAPFVHSTTICPLLAIENGHQQHLLSGQLSQWQPDVVIFISPNAVSNAFKVITSKQLQQCQVLALGTSTKQALEQQGITRVIAPNIETSEGLLTEPCLQNVAGKRVLIIRGNGGREHIRTKLQERGAKVAYNEVYQRQLVPLSKSQTIEQWRQQQINCIVVTSMQLLERCWQLIDDKQFAKQCHWIVVSDRIKERALDYGLDKVINSFGANHKNISKAIQDIVT
ncbi:uroporphyrinogen-III synthase [Thalassotalea maritima]|uniref:uroporphyrinogen-III synthase n=1 Tax=Thalassotalea maritima TaxID=3242416 RepID=UPI0035277C39